MKRAATVAVAMTVLILSLVLTGTAFAHPTVTSKCSGCHTTDAKVTLTVTPVSNDGTNATYSVTVANPYGTVGWGVFNGNTKVAGTAAGSATFSVPAGVTYTVYGVSGNNKGTEGYSSTTIAPVKSAAPAAPSLAASYPTANGSVAISWAAVTGATSYEYQVSTGATVTTTATSVSLSGLPVGTTSFKLRAVNAAGASAWTSSSIVYTVAAPAVPTLPATYPTAVNSVTISWPAVSGATSYDYQVGAGSVITTTSTSVTVTGLAVGPTAFKVRATNVGGSSTYASTSIVYSVAVPSPPTLSASYPTAVNSVTISWPAVSGATGYDYQVGAGSVIATTSTSVTLTGLAVGTTTFQVRATNAGGPSAYTQTSIVYTVPVVAPGVPSLLASYPTATNSVTISWAAVSGATSYNYQVGTGSVLSTTSTSVSLTGLAVGTTAFKLRATNSVGSSAYATSSIIYTVPQTAPGAPSLSASYPTTTGAVTISWPAVTGATSYQYQLGSGAVTTVTATSVSLSSLPVGTTAFKLRASNNVGSSAYTSSNVVYTPPAPGAPVIASTYPVAVNSVTISWPAVTGATSYQYQLGSGAVTTITATSVTLSSLPVGTSSFKVRASNAGGSSAYATSSVVYTVPAPAAPTIAATYDTSDGSITISWPAVTDATGYEYQIAGGSIVSTSATSVTLTGLAQGPTSFAVRATNAGGPSGWSNAVVTYTPPVVVPGAPTIAPNFVAPSGTVTVTWAAVPGATSYEYYIAGGPSTVTDTNSAQLAGLVYGTSTFMVRAVNSAGSSTYSMASLFVPDPPAPPVVAFTAIRSTAHRYVRFAGVVGGVSTPTPVRVAVFVYKASAHKYVKYVFNTTTLASGAFSVRVRLGRSGRAYAVVTSNGLQKRSKAFVVRP